ncbi:MAG: hypothetical protein ABSD62_05245 [Candidatus Limnocylindrales bacterium]|jgi:hypothetical protein
MAGRGSWGGDRLALLVACICFAIAVLTYAGVFSFGGKIDWTDLGLFFGFLSFII